MTYSIRPIIPEDEDVLWLILFYAAHVNEEAGKTLADAKANQGLAKYVSGWGRSGDLGLLAVDESGKALGAVWARLFAADDKAYSATDESTPEIAIAVLPDVIGRGIGTALMKRFIEVAKTQFSAIALNVRADNPALRLYQRLGFEIIGEMTNRVGTLSYDMRLVFSN